MKKVIFSLMVFASTLTATTFVHGSVSNYYVANNGKNEWTGKLPEPNASNTDGPFASIWRARKEYRRLRENGRINGPVNIFIRKGTYRFCEPFLLNQRDSGTAEAPLTYQAYPGEEVVISGGKELKLNWQPYQNAIFIADISEFVKKYGFFNSLFINDRKATRARMPNEGEYFNTKGYNVPHIVIQAEKATLSCYETKTDGNVTYVIVPEGTPNETSFNPNAPHLTFTFQITTPGHYAFAIRGLHDGDTKGYIYVQVDADEPEKCKIAAKGEGAFWQWIKNNTKPTNFIPEGDWTLRYYSAGNHTITVYHHAERVRFDAFAVTQRYSAFQFYVNDISKNWTNLNDVELVASQSFRQIRSRIRSIEADKVTLVTSAAELFENRDTRYYVDNAFEGLDSPGEWYLDKTNCQLYYWPLPSEDVSSLRLNAPVIESLFQVIGKDENNKVQHFRIKGLIFSHTDWRLPNESQPKPKSCVDIRFADNFQFTNNIIRNVGEKGLELSNTSNGRIALNKIHNVGGPGIDASNTDGIYIKNNAVYNIGEVFEANGGILADTNSRLTISRNEISFCPYTGIHVTSTLSPASLTHNHVHHVMQKLNDGGGIYTYQDKTADCPAVTIKNNIVHDVKPTHHHEKYHGTLIIRGIYLDALTRNYSITNNLIYRTLTGLKANGGSSNILIENNMFVDADEGQITFNGVSDNSTNIFRKNIIFYTNPNAGLFLVSKRSTLNPGLRICEDNLYFNPAYGSNPNSYFIIMHEDKWNYSLWKDTFGFDQYSIIGDPCFVDYEDDDFSLCPNSIAFDLGFKTIDFSNVGPIK